MSRAKFPRAPDRHYEFTNKGVVIIGAGIGGMLQAIDLLQRGITNFVILEKGTNFGGTWLQNQYPGCACDVLSLLYSISFEQNASWSREYPGQEEMLEYLINVASKYQLYRFVRFSSSVMEVKWDDESAQWQTDVRADGASSEYHERYTIRSDFLISAVGQLNQPSYPDIKGVGKFHGKSMHSARWDWSYDLRGKRAAIIGSGATAAQILPEVAQVLSHVTLYSRTPNWVVSRFDGPVPEWRKAMFKLLPFVQHRFRAEQMNFREWAYGIVSQDKDVSAVFRNDALHKLQQVFPNDAEMRAKLTPDYAVGCKRVIVSDDFLPALSRPHVRLETDPILEIDETGILTSHGDGKPPSHEDIDLLILATGFRTVEFMHPIKVTGRGGRPLAHIWSGGAHALNGVTVQDLPNFGMLYGPNTNLGHNSIIIMEESQAKYIGTLAEAVLDARRTKRAGASTLDKEQQGRAKLLSLCPKSAAVERFNSQLQSELSATSFADPACKSWYKDAKSGKITNNWSERVVTYQKLLERVVWDDYEDGEFVVRQRNGQKTTINPRVVEETTLSNSALVGMSIAGIALTGTVASFLLQNWRGLRGLWTV